MKNLQGWMILGIACLAGCVGTTIPVQAQQTATAIVVKERLVEHVGDRLIIDMKLALESSKKRKYFRFYFLSRKQHPIFQQNWQHKPNSDYARR